jgi:hypothetical protein
MGLRVVLCHCCLYVGAISLGTGLQASWTQTGDHWSCGVTLVFRRSTSGLPSWLGDFMSAMAHIVYLAARGILPPLVRKALKGEPLEDLLSEVSTTLVGCTLRL